GKPHRDLAEKRRDRMVPVIFHSASLATASAVRPPNGVALGLRRDDLLLEAGQQQLPFGQGQPQVGDITEIIRPVDLQDVGALSLTVSPGFHQPHNPSHAPTPDQRSDAKLPLRHPHPQSPGSPVAKADTDIKVLIRRSLDAVGQTEDTALTAFTDGCSGLRRILADAGVTEAPMLDWFHIAMRLQHLEQTAGGLSADDPA